jgi:hypothetical protein
MKPAFRLHTLPHTLKPHMVLHLLFWLASSTSSSEHTRHLPFVPPHTVKKETRQSCPTRYPWTASRPKCHTPCSHKSLGTPLTNKWRWSHGNSQPTSWPMAISCPWGHNKWHLGLLQVPAIYLAHNGAAFTIQAYKIPTYFLITAGTTAQQREEIATNISMRKAWGASEDLKTYLL